MWTNFEIGYLSGMIDGEGSIYIQYRMEGSCKNFFPRIQIVNTNQDVIDWIKNKFGGNIVYRNRNKVNPKWKDSYEWYTTRESLDKLIPLLIPHLIIKKQHAIIIQEFRKTFTGKAGGRRVSPEFQAIREECYQKLKQLNHRGPLLSSPVSPSA